MADRELSYKITTDSTQATAGIKQFSSAVKKELKASADAFDDTRSAGQKVAESIKQVASTVERELQGAEEAAAALRTALGDTADKVDVAQAVADLRKLGLTFDQITVDAGELGSAIRQLDDSTSSIDNVKTKAGEVEAGMGKAQDATHSFVGNAVSELPGVSDSFGPLGEAAGQLTEGLLAGEVAMSGLVAAAGPIAGVLIAVKGVTEYLGGIKADKAFKAELVDKFTTAIKEGSSALKVINDELEDTGEIAVSLPGGFLGLGRSTKDLAGIARDAGLSYKEFQAALTDAGALESYRTKLDDLRESARLASDDPERQAALQEQARTYQMLVTGLDQYQTSIGVASTSQEQLDAWMGKTNEGLVNAGQLWGGLRDTLDEVNTKAKDAAADAKELAAKQRDAANAAAEHKQKLDELYGRINDKTAWLNLQNTFDTTSTAVTEGLQAWETGAADAEQQVRDADLATQNLKSSVADYATEVLGLPPEVVTDLLLDIDQGKQDEVENFLTNLSYGVTVPITYKEGNRPIKGAFMAGTRNAPGGMANTAEGGPELMVGPGVRFVPQGAAVYTAMETRRIMNALASGQQLEPTVIDQRQFHVTIVTRATDGRGTAAALDDWYRVNGGRR